MGCEQRMGNCIGGRALRARISPLPWFAFTGQQYFETLPERGACLHVLLAWAQAYDVDTEVARRALSRVYDDISEREAPMPGVKVRHGTACWLMGRILCPA
jgi:hypothetical protein